VSPATPRARAGAAAKPEHPLERLHFKELMLANHFGTFAESELKAQAVALGNTSYEQLMCLGYNPQKKRLDAVVHIKLDGGYNGDLCTPGSQEYVKFFASTDGGATWTNLGTTSFTVWDVPGVKPLEYDATLHVDLAEECCKEENLVLIRGILSWEVPPGGPNDPVVWGNALDVMIQVEPKQSGKLIDLFACLDLKVAFDEVVELVDAEQTIAFGVQKALSPVELHETYKATDVPPHRYLLSHVSELLAAPALLTEKLSQPDFKLFPGIEVDISELIKYVIDPQGNETYEQIGCVGLNEYTSELVATIDVKLSSGYSGGLCTNGSREYVAFWVDWGGGWDYVGTTAVNVHDIKSMPKDGLEYSVALPFPQLYTHKRPCHDGPVEARVRAVLSWATPPSTTNPYAVPVWGGHAETHILLPPGDPITQGGPILQTIGRMDIDLPSIDVNGLGQGAAALGGFAVQDSPFGGQVTFSGKIMNRAMTQWGGSDIYYRIWIYDGTSWHYMNTTFDVKAHVGLNPTAINHHQTPQSLPAPFGDGWYKYWEDGFTTVDENALGYWQSTGNGQALIYMEAKDSLGWLGSPSPPSPKLIQLDNMQPFGTIAITSGGGSCGDFKIGDTIVGSYTASDNENIGSVGFAVLPALGGGTFSHVPTTATITFQDGTWQLDTTGMDPCGYVVRLDVNDRTNVDSRGNPWYWPAYTGFCLKK
jgi:hypothetical protein